MDNPITVYVPVDVYESLPDKNVKTIFITKDENLQSAIPGLRPLEQSFTHWLKKQQGYLLTKERYEALISGVEEYKKYVLSVLKENYETSKNLVDEDKIRSAQDMVNETYEDLIFIFSGIDVNETLGEKVATIKNIEFMKNRCNICGHNPCLCNRPMDY